jgi:hypothetical protein
MTMNMVLPGQVLAALRSAGVYPDGVSIGDATDKATWRVQPESMMEAAAPVFVAFDTDAANTAQQWYLVRTERDTLLYACDWTQATDSPLSDADALAWRTYRTALRQVPQVQSDPYAIVWPTPPFVIDPLPY